MRQAIIWTNDVKFTDAYMRHSASMNELPVQYLCRKLLENVITFPWAPFY